MKHTSSIISNQWLFENLNHPDIAIFDCRFSLANPQEGKTQYETSHIPGAYYLDLNRDLSSTVQKQDGNHHKLLQEFLQNSPSSRIIYLQIPQYQVKDVFLHAFVLLM
ncbi:MAG: rhodanese-like domain-containing protein, partial [Cyanobacteria bacterium J06632_19]